MRGAHATHAVHNRLPAVLAGLDVPLGELARRTMLPARTLARLRAPHANPPFRVAERIARALDVRVEALFVLAGRAALGGSRAAPARTGLGPLLAEPVRVDQLALFTQTHWVVPFRVVARFPFQA